MSIKQNRSVDQYLQEGCMRCKYGATPQCKVHSWRPILLALRALLLDTPLTEERKWGAPCYTHNGKNILMLGAFKDYVSIGFFKGAGLSDKTGLLVSPGSNSRSTKAVRITQLSEVKKFSAAIRKFVREAIHVEEQGVKLLKADDPIALPPEFDEVIKKDADFKRAFYALTPGRQRGYGIHFSQPRQSTTRTSRIQQCREQILRGEGLHDAYRNKAR